MDPSPQMTSCDVSIVIVTYNSLDCIDECLNSVSTQRGVAFEIIIIDNNSSDGTAEKLRKNGWRVIENKENIGFGRACNQAFEQTAGKYIYFINPDAQLMGENSLAQLYERMKRAPEWGLAGTKVLEGDGEYESKPSLTYPGQGQAFYKFSKPSGSIAWVIGASLIIRRDLFQELGGFDPRFFLYSEETDLCLRARKKGHAIGYVHEVVVNHIGGKSENGKNPQEISARKLQGLLLFREKHYSDLQCIQLARKDYRRAFLRMLWNRAVLFFNPQDPVSLNKYKTYKGIWETSRKYLREKKIK
jgi:GT2 family glycosyltransferase